MPNFPEFKPIEIRDREIIQKAILEYQPEISDISFTNLFIWRAHYDIIWSQYKNWLLFIYERAGCGLMPVGPTPRLEPTLTLLSYMKKRFGNGSILERVDQRLVFELSENGNFIIEPTRSHFDYVYRSEDLNLLAGRKYNAKRNHLNIFRKNNQFSYREITEKDMVGCLEMANRWCQEHSCSRSMEIHDEYLAVINALNYFNELDLKGGLIEINGKIEAFTIGEMLNNQTAVIHVEKADSTIRGLYAAINQQFVEHNWTTVPYINREQDLGEPQLRKSKESYYPDRMVEKYRIRLK